MHFKIAGRVAIALGLIGISSWVFSEAKDVADNVAPQRPSAEWLDVDQAFDLMPMERRLGRLLLTWHVAPGYYLYRDKIEMDAAVSAPTPLVLGLPQADLADEGPYGNVPVYRGKLSVAVNLSNGAQSARTIRVRYQGCAEAGYCYPPQVRLVEIPANTQ